MSTCNIMSHIFKYADSHDCPPDLVVVPGVSATCLLELSVGVGLWLARGVTGMVCLLMSTHFVVVCMVSVAGDSGSWPFPGLCCSYLISWSAGVFLGTLSNSSRLGLCSLLLLSNR